MTNKDWRLQLVAAAAQRAHVKLDTGEECVLVYAPSPTIPIDPKRKARFDPTKCAVRDSRKRGGELVSVDSTRIVEIIW